jgi:hypothetical protein
MKKMLHFFSRPGEERDNGSTAYLFREPTFDPSDDDSYRAPPIEKPTQHAGQWAADAGERMPADYAGIVAFFEKTVLERKSPYSALLKAADRLQEYIPNEVSRLKAAYALCAEQWQPDALSFAIGTHIADIDHAREKARNNRREVASEQAAGLRSEAQRLSREQDEIESEIQDLTTQLERLQDRLQDNRTQLDAIQGQLRQAECEANSMCFVDQAAENIKSDLLARKVILGLP